MGWRTPEHPLSEAQVRSEVHPHTGLVEVMAAEDAQEIDVTLLEDDEPQAEGSE